MPPSSMRARLRRRDPTRVCAGIVYFRDRFYYHAWAESYAEGCWVPVDPGGCPGFVDATHIKFTGRRRHAMRRREESAGSTPRSWSNGEVIPRLSGPNADRYCRVNRNSSRVAGGYRRPQRSPSAVAPCTGGIAAVPAGGCVSVYSLIRLRGCPDSTCVSASSLDGSSAAGV